MATVKTDYGLIYKDDGSLCVTRRTDDVPFPGTTAWAVESGTTNVITNPLPDGTANWSKSDNNGSVSTLTYDENEECLILEVTATGSGYPRLTSNGFGPLNILSLSFYAKADANGKKLNTNFYEGGSTKIYRTHTLTTTWQRYTCSIDTTYNLSRMYFVPHTVGTYYIKLIQVEALPFATSFVNGTRAGGKLYIPLEKLPFNPQTDNFVISYWKKPIGTHDSLNGYNISSIGRYTSDNSAGYIWWGKDRYTDDLRLSVTYLGGGISDNWSYLGIEYFNKWHHEVLVRDGTPYKYYFDGEKRIEITVAEEKPTFQYGMYLGGYSTAPANNSLIADPFLGNPYDENNNLVWTDDYVRQVYEARAPFNVPPKIPVT